MNSNQSACWSSPEPDARLVAHLFPERKGFVKGLYYCDWFEVYASNLALAVAAASHQVTLIAREPSPEHGGRKEDAQKLRQELLQGGVNLQVLTGRHSSVASLFKLRKIIRQNQLTRYDYFHIQQTRDPRFLCAAYFFPTVLTLHEPGPREGVTQTLNVRSRSTAVIEYLYRRLADLIVVHTEAGLQNLSPNERSKAVVIPHGVRTSAGDRREPSRTVLFFGRAVKYKGINILLSAMAEVWKVEPRARLRILASPGDDEYRQQTQDGRVTATWDGYSEAELDSELSRAGAVCLPYLSATGSGVGSRAYGAGIPIVASDLEGIRELASHEDLVVEPANVADLARALLLALSNDYGIQSTDPQRTWPGVARAHIEYYDTIVTKYAHKPKQGLGQR